MGAAQFNFIDESIPYTYFNTFTINDIDNVRELFEDLSVPTVILPKRTCAAPFRGGFPSEVMGSNSDRKRTTRSIYYNDGTIVACDSRILKRWTPDSGFGGSR